MKTELKLVFATLLMSVSWNLFPVQRSNCLASISTSTLPAIRAESRANRERREANRKAKEELVLTDRQLDISVGMMLGDASLGTQNGGKTWRMKFQMAAKRRDYSERICTEFGKQWIPSEPHFIQRSNSEMLGFQTITSQNLQVLADLFIDKQEVNGTTKFRKVYKSGTITKHMTGRGLAYWFMDDGGKADYTPNEGKGIVFNTHCFSETEVLEMCDELRDKFGLETSMKFNKKKPIVLLSGRSFETFEGLVRPHLVPSMESKMPTPRRKRG